MYPDNLVLDAIEALSARVRALECNETPVIAGGGSGAPSDAPYVVIALDGDLSAERRLQATTPIVLTDAGANADATLTHAVSGAAAATYGSATQAAQIAVSTLGHITSAANVAIMGVPPSVHNVLDSTYHGDVLTGTVVRGDLLYGNATSKIARLALGGAAGSFVRRDATDVLWSTLVLPNSATTGDLLLATGANAIGNLVDVAAGQPLLSGGVGVIPAYAGWNLAGTAGQTYSFPAAGGTVALLNAANVFTALNTFSLGLTFNGASGVNVLTIPDNTAIAATLVDVGATEYLRVISTDAQPIMVFNEGGVDVDFRFEGIGQSAALFVRGSDGFVGIGLTFPGSPLSVYRTAGQVSISVGVQGSAATDSCVWIFERGGGTKWDMGCNVLQAGSNDFMIREDNTNALIRLTIQDATGFVGVCTASPDRTLHVEYNLATSAAIAYAARLTRYDSTAGALTAGDGVGLEFELETATSGTNQVAATIAAAWVDPANATRKARGYLQAYDTAARECIRWEASGAAPMVGFYGGAAVVRGAALTVALTTITHTAPGTPDYAVQDFVDVSLGAGWAFKDHDEANSVLAALANAQTRIADLEARLNAATGVNLIA